MFPYYISYQTNVEKQQGEVCAHVFAGCIAAKAYKR